MHGRTRIFIRDHRRNIPERCLLEGRSHNDHPDEPAPFGHAFAALAHDIDTFTGKYGQARPREQPIETERRQRILSALEEADRRLMQADLDGATRLFNMASSYAEVLESVEGAWRGGYGRRR